MEFLYPFLIAIAVIGVTILIVLGLGFVKKKFNKSKEDINKVFDVAKMILNFVSFRLRKEIEDDDRYDKIFTIVLELIDFMGEINDDIDAEELIEASIESIDIIAEKYEFELIEEDREIIKNMLILVDDLIISFN